MLLPIALGRSPDGATFFVDLGHAVHLLLAGGTAAGVAHCLSAALEDLVTRHSPLLVRIVVSSMATPSLCRFAAAPHQDRPPVTCADDGLKVLTWAVEVMEWRYRMLALAGARNFEQYNRVAAESVAAAGAARPELRLPHLPRLVLVIDELHVFRSVGMTDVEEAIGRLDQMSRAVGINLIVATSHPTPDVLAGYIKANLPVRLALRVGSKADSRAILDCHGAEALGDDEMLLLPRNWHRLIPLRALGIVEPTGVIATAGLPADATRPGPRMDR
jgi:S-DNA-T family DNA segregation ATPase FtsK/SpoIIIE